MKNLILAILLALPSVSQAADYSAEKLPPYLYNMARRLHVHEEILSQAAKAGVSQDGFESFYSQKAAEKLKELHAGYYKAISEAASRPQAAAENYARLASKNPAKGENNFFAALAYEAAGRYDEAFKSYEAAFSADPGGCDGIAYYHRARLLGLLGYGEEAASDYGKSLEIVAGNSAALLGRAREYLGLAMYSESARDLSAYFSAERSTTSLELASIGEECELLASKGLRITGCADLEKRADALLSSGTPSYSQSIAQAEAAVVRREGTPPQQIAEAYCLQSAKVLRGADRPLLRLRTALYLMDKAVELSPEGRPFARRAMIKYRIAQLRGAPYINAAGDFRKAAELGFEKDKGWSCRMLCAVYLKYGEIPAALEEINKAVAADPENRFFRHERASAHLLAGELEKAAADMKKFFALGGDADYSEKVAKGP